MSLPATSTLKEFNEHLNAAAIIGAAIRIEGTRTDRLEQDLLAFHGWGLSGLTTTPFMLQAGINARSSGCVAFNGLERSFLPAPDHWVHPTLTAADYAVTRARDTLKSSKSWPFRHDAAMADFSPRASPKWWSHSLIHSLIGFGAWSSMSEWDVMLMARLGEASASAHWYWLAELGRAYCPLHSVASGDATPDCDACRRLETLASRSSVILERLNGPHAGQIAENLLGVLRYEANAFEQGREEGVLLQPRGRYLDLGEAGDYALFHHRRLVSSEWLEFTETCLRPGVDTAGSLDAFEAKVVRVLAGILGASADGPAEPSARVRRVLQDLGARSAQAMALGALPRAALRVVSGAIHQLTPTLAETDAESLLVATIDELAGLAGPFGASLFAVGYRPTIGTAEPSPSLNARSEAYVQRLHDARTPLMHFVPRDPELIHRVLAGPRTEGLMDEAFAAAMAPLESEDVGALLLQAFFGWLKVASEKWGPDNATQHIEGQWFYRSARRTFPLEDEWPDVRLRPNPYLDAVPGVLDVRWLEGLIADPDLPLRPRPVTNIAYVLVGQGRHAPLFLPFTDRRKRLLDALQFTPSITELVSEGFGPAELRLAVAEELVLAIHHGTPFRLAMPQQPVPEAKSSRRPPVEDAISATGVAHNPWESEDQALYYEAYCKRSGLYRDLATATIAFGGLDACERVVDLGCGTGVSTAAVLRQGARRVMAVDPSPRMLAVARRLVSDPRVVFTQGAASELAKLVQGLNPDGVLCNSAFWLDPSLRDSMVSVAEALAGGGRFALSLPAEFMGHVEHRLTEEAQLFYAAVDAARVTSALDASVQPLSPHPGLLGSADAFLSALESSGFTGVEHTIWRFAWTASDYLDWLSQPAVAVPMTPGLGEDARKAFFEAVRRAVDPDLPLESHWALVRASVVHSA